MERNFIKDKPNAVHLQVDKQRNVQVALKSFFNDVFLIEQSAVSS
jgi:hypothetical protein